MKFKISLSEDDKCELKQMIGEAVEEKFKNLKYEQYTDFQKEMLKMNLDYFAIFLNCFFETYRKNQEKKKPKMVFAKYNTNHLLNFLKKSPSEKQLKKHFEKNIHKYQSGVFLELLALTKIFKEKTGDGK